jgi:TRAP-type C4-dicarboxylate transport system substrate-binding protein
MRGMKIRSLPSRMHSRTYEMLGAIPLIMDLKPALAAIKAGELDAQENPLANIVDYGVHKFHRYHTLTGHSYLSRGIFCNRAAYDSWPAALQTAMQEATHAAILAQRDLAEREEEIARRTIVEAGGEIVELTPDERAQFVRAVKPLHDEARQRFDEAFALLDR